jgi:hypothetical protein
LLLLRRKFLVGGCAAQALLGPKSKEVASAVI